MILILDCKPVIGYIEPGHYLSVGFEGFSDKSPIYTNPGSIFPLPLVIWL